MKSSAFKCGYVSIVGRPNAGKSTLINKILGQKISITSEKPQTTRHRILGIKTCADYQIVFVDTPGIQSGSKTAMNRYMNRAATTSINDVDVILFVTDGLHWREEDEYVAGKLATVEAPVILLVNKVDKIKDKEQLLPHLANLSGKHAFNDIIPVSAKTGDSLDILEKIIVKNLPESPAFFPEDQVTDRSERFLAAELIREKLMRLLGEELPYSLTVEIEKFEDQGSLKRISAVIWVSKPGQKAIVIGKQGGQLKKTGELARKDMESVFGCKVFLQLWVKVKEGWSDDERALRSLGYSDDI